MGMSGGSFLVCSALCLMMYDCGPNSRFTPRKADPTKGTVTGTVFCTDTGKPARFATVQLLPGPNARTGEGAPGDESTVTDLDGKFKIEAVAPGDYFAYATQDGYLDPIYGIDFDQTNTKTGDNEQRADMIEQWKDHLVEVSVGAHSTSDLTIQMDRGAEVSGTISYDDGSPAIGMRFALYRKGAKGGWSAVGPQLDREFALEQKSGARGRYSITNLPAGEYAVCTLLPGENQSASPQVCLGNTFRRREAQTVKASAGDTVSGADIVIPLHSIHAVGGSIVQAVRTEPPSKAKVHLLYADDREEVMLVDMYSDGSFLFPFVPEGAYIVKVTDASYAEPVPGAEPAGDSAKAPAKVHALVNKEIGVTVRGEVNDIKVSLTEVPQPAVKP